MALRSFSSQICLGHCKPRKLPGFSCREKKVDLVLSVPLHWFHQESFLTLVFVVLVSCEIYRDQDFKMYFLVQVFRLCTKPHFENQTLHLFKGKHFTRKLLVCLMCQVFTGKAVKGPDRVASFG